MRSFAVWYKEKQKELGANRNYAQENSVCIGDDEVRDNKTKHNKTEIIADVHINLWESKICQNSDDMVCFDIGVMVSDVTYLDKLNIYCPFKVEKSGVQDLNHKIIENTDLVGAIFNENYSACTGFPRRLIIKSDNDERKVFVIYELDIENDLDIQYIPQSEHDNSCGSLLAFSLDNVASGEYKDGEKLPVQYYFRVRISVNEDKLKVMFQEAKNNSPIQDAFLVTQVIDFRLNNLRSCSRFVSDKFAKDDKFKIRQVHYLILRRATDVFIHQGEEVSSRLLEKSLWRKYIDGLDESVIAYHFKKTWKSPNKPVDDFGVLARFEYQQINKKRLMVYLVCVVIISVISGLITNFISVFTKMIN